TRRQPSRKSPRQRVSDSSWQPTSYYSESSRVAKLPFSVGGKYEQVCPGIRSSLLRHLHNCTNQTSQSSQTAITVSRGHESRGRAPRKAGRALQKWRGIF